MGQDRTGVHKRERCPPSVAAHCLMQTPPSCPHACMQAAGACAVVSADDVEEGDISGLVQRFADSVVKVSLTIHNCTICMHKHV